MKAKLFVGLSLGLVIIIYLFYKFNTHKDSDIKILQHSQQATQVKGAQEDVRRTEVERQQQAIKLEEMELKKAEANQKAAEAQAQAAKDIAARKAEADLQQEAKKMAEIALKKAEADQKSAEAQALAAKVAAETEIKKVEMERQLREQAEKAKKDSLLTDCKKRFQDLVYEFKNAPTTWFMKQIQTNVADALTIKADSLLSECPQINPDIENLKKMIVANKD